MSADQRDWKPIPDPTLLTTQQLDREMLHLREKLEIRIGDGDQRIATLERRTENAISREEHNGLVAQVNQLREWQAAQGGKTASANWIWQAALGVAMLVIAYLALKGH